MIAKLAEEQDFDFYYKLKCDDENVLWSGHMNAPDKEKLKNWFLVNIKRDDRYFFLFFNEENKHDIIGYLYLDVVGDNMDTIDTGHGVHSSHTGKGYGTIILQRGIEYAKKELPQIHYFQGWIMSDNIGSIKNVLRLGYYKTDENKIIKTGKDEEKLMEKYLLKIKEDIK